MIMRQSVGIMGMVCRDLNRTLSLQGLGCGMEMTWHILALSPPTTAQNTLMFPAEDFWESHDQ